MNKLLVVIVAVVLSGCTSLSDIENRAAQRDKAARFYDSVGQPQAASENRQLAEKEREDATKIFPFIVEVWNIVTKGK